jgi:hypothetical protein
MGQIRCTYRKWRIAMTREQKRKIRDLYARTLVAGDGDRETMPEWAAEKLARREKLDVILDQLDGHPDLDEILGEDDYE